MINKLKEAFQARMNDFHFEVLVPDTDALLEEEIDIWANEHPELTREEIKEVLELFDDGCEFLPPTAK